VIAAARPGQEGLGRRPGRAGGAPGQGDPAAQPRPYDLQRPEQVPVFRRRARREHGDGTAGHNLAFLYGDGERADEAQTRAGHDAGAYERLAVLKAAHDPHNLFRLNRNIRPSGSGR
jgi:hypothetical protein